MLPGGIQNDYQIHSCPQTGKNIMWPGNHDTPLYKNTFNALTLIPFSATSFWPDSEESNIGVINKNYLEVLENIYIVIHLFEMFIVMKGIVKDLHTINQKIEIWIEVKMIEKGTHFITWCCFIL